MKEKKIYREIIAVLQIPPIMAKMGIKDIEKKWWLVLDICCHNVAISKKSKIPKKIACPFCAKEHGKQ